MADTATVVEPVLTLPQTVPDRTIAWQILAWADEYLRQPDGPDAGASLTFTREQVMFLLWWYALDDAGRFRYLRGQLRRAKGWGKSPIGGAVSIIELAGPCRFGGWDAAGDPVAVPVPVPWVQLTAVSERQTTNTMAMVLGMVAESPIVDDYDFDVGKTRILTPGGGRLEPVTASAQSAEGGRPTFVSATETQWWFANNGGHKLDQVNRRNLGKSRDGAARLLEDTNAHAVGDDSVAERTWRAWRKELDETGTSRILMDSRAAPETIDLDDDDELTAGIDVAYGDSVWVDRHRIFEEVRDPGTSPSEAWRFYLNVNTTSSDRWRPPDEPDAITVPDRLNDGDTVVLAFDGSEGGPGGKSGPADSTVLLAVRLADMLVEPVGVWSHDDPMHPWKPPRAEVNLTVDEAHDRFNVVRAYGDPRGWETDIDQWIGRHGVWRGWPTYRRGPMTDAIDRSETALRAQDVKLADDPKLRAHLRNAVCDTTNVGQRVYKRIIKPSIYDKVDAAVTLVLGIEAAGDAIAAGEGKRGKRRPGAFL